MCAAEFLHWFGDLAPCSKTRVRFFCSSKMSTMPKSDSALDLPEKADALKAAVAVESEEFKAATQLLQNLTLGEQPADTSADIVKFVQDNGIACVQKFNIAEQLLAAMENKASPAAREAAMVAFKALSEAFGQAAEPFLLPLLETVLKARADKVPAVTTAADAAITSFVSAVQPAACKQVLPVLFACMDHKLHWQTKLSAVNAIISLTKTAERAMALCLPEIVPEVTAIMCDAKKQVVTAAFEAMKAACASLDNMDVKPFVPAMISAIANNAEVPDCIHKLGATTFVQAVEAPTLSMLVPVLIRGLRERSTPIRRKAAVIIDNMAKLVDNPLDAAVFLPRLLPGVETLHKEVADPECRAVAEKALATLASVSREGQEVAAKKVELSVVLSILKESLAAYKSDIAITDTLVNYVAEVALFLIQKKWFEEEEWTAAVAPYLVPVLGAEGGQTVTVAFAAACIKYQDAATAEEEDDEEGEELCNCEFSLAYGAKILLNNARLRLKRGKRYGLCGPNGAGKSTLMRSIANGQVEGFPPATELRTVYVEHDIDGCHAETAVWEFVFGDQTLQDLEKTSQAEVEQMLTSVGFTDAMQKSPVESLSGGWKMKLALARAMLMKADIFLLDEPTNHLDVRNVKWLEDYLVSLHKVTSIIVSHDSGFLDRVCTDIIHYENRKLKIYKGNLSAFVKAKPEARSYYELGAAQYKFTLPEPGFLEGVKTKDRAILKMYNVGFTYPNTERQILKGVSLFCSLASRVAVVGPNGAGKSTLIKILCGEMEPVSGTVWKHPNLRIAYVAQHAFHHIEQHLDKSPNQYIQWRYAIGEDREALDKVDRKLTEADEKALAQKIAFDGEKRQVDKIHGRRKAKKTYEYDVQWVGQPLEKNSWVGRDQLEEWGLGKMVTEIDMKEAARMGMIQRPLTQLNIEKHLNDVGLEPEFATHSQMRGLSGGQKVKVVLGAAMWNQPHMLVLDEPTNYLDRDSLGALSGAIKEFGGGVVIISHNAEFTDTVCTEQWTLDAGVMTRKGESAVSEADKKIEFKVQEEMTDAMGNTIKIKQPKMKLSNKDKKKQKKLRDARRARGEEVTDSEEEE